MITEVSGQPYLRSGKVLPFLLSGGGSRRSSPAFSYRFAPANGSLKMNGPITGSGHRLFNIKLIFRITNKAGFVNNFSPKKVCRTGNKYQTIIKYRLSLTFWQ